MISVIIPTYNERENIKKLIPMISKVLKNLKHEIIIVDDNSKDGTAEEALKLSKKYNVKVLVRSKKLGLASAIIFGLKKAKYDYIAVMDADLQHNPIYLPLMINEMKKGYDLVIGSRYLKNSKIIEFSILRKFLSKFAIFLIRNFVNNAKNVKDPLSGYFVTKKEILKEIKVKSKGFKILVEIIGSQNLKIKEIPIIFYPRKYGKTKLNILTEIKEIFSQILRLTNPFYKFLIVGCIGTFVNLFSLSFFHFLKVQHFIGSLISIENSIISNFLLHETYTFRKFFKENYKERFLKYHLTSLQSIFAQYVISNILFYIFSFNPIFSQFIGILFGFALNYLASKKWVWK